MTIQSRGWDVKIVSFHGQMQPDGLRTPVTLVRVEAEWGQQAYRFAESLTATNGYEEIDAALHMAGYIELDSDDLINAINEAM